MNGHGTLRYRGGNSCVVCHKANSKKRWANGEKRPSKYDPEYRRNKNLQKKFGITSAEFEAMNAAQAYGCALCGGPPGGSANRFHVDHDHKTGKIRALLCHKCNVGLGSFDDSPDKLRLAIAYLGRH